MDFNDEISEAEALSNIYDYQESEQEAFDRRLNDLSHKREAVKKAIVGSIVSCPSCGKKFKKKSYQSTFCSNKGRKNCKDWFNNRINQNRYESMIGRELDEF